MLFGKVYCTACAISVAVPSAEDSRITIVCPTCKNCLMRATVGDGYVYILENELMPGVIKIGMTDRDPFQRAEELSSATGVPAPFEVRAYFFAARPEHVEAAIHEAFTACRLRGREFFRISLADALRHIHDHFGEQVSDITIWEHDHWTTFTPVVFEQPPAKSAPPPKSPPPPKLEPTPAQIAARQQERAEKRRLKQEEQRKRRERELRWIRRYAS